jgi:phosphopantothenoylcysteine synthetase/decarboxylase
MQTPTMRDDALSIIVSGSSAAIGMPAYLAWLRQEIDLSLRVLLTHSAERFLQPQVVAWHADEVFTSDDASLNPTEFAKRSLGIVVLPATANMLVSAALGLAATPAQTVLLSSDRPVLFFPAMNATMWAKNSTQGHVAALRAEGHTVVDPQERGAFELWQRENVVGPALPPPDEAAETIVAWLENYLSAAAGEGVYQRSVVEAP